MASEDDRNRFVSAMRTLDVMISYRKWEEACAIVAHELNWLIDPEPDFPWHSTIEEQPGMNYKVFTHWGSVLRALEKKRAAHSY